MVNSIKILPHERIDDLCVNDLKIIQDPNGFCFGMDAILLAHFANVKKGDNVLDLGTGTGIIPLLLSAHTKASHITGIELQNDVAGMATRSICLNSLEDKIDILNADIQDFRSIIKLHSYDYVTCNPPYKKSGTGLTNANQKKLLSSHEQTCGLDTFINAASHALKFGKKASFIIKAERFMDVLLAFKNADMEPKRIQFVYPRINKPPNLMLIEAIKNGKPDINWMSPLLIYKDDGTYSDQYLSFINEGNLNE